MVMVIKSHSKVAFVMEIKISLDADGENLQIFTNSSI